ncbi:restriction endonuclease [Dyella flagellata]|uniref:Membrane protein n=1 Tax=Dyella flagellata TaxID=1867833 RepID=A0ABQ5XIB2_9GAMM|nr:membrane protein [Dyella flagellata]
MARRKGSGIELLASMPWPIGFALGIVAYLVIRYGIGWYFASTNNPILQGMGKPAATGIYAPLAWFVLVASWIGALASFLRRRHRRHLLETQTGLDSLRTMTWREFEMVVGEAFRRQGYVISEMGLGGADGGIDLILRKDGQVILAQCKQWKTQRVDVKVVREMFGLLVDHGAAAVKIVAIGEYTADARRFAEGKSIELINGETLLAMIRGRQKPMPAELAMAAIDTPEAIRLEPGPSQNPTCPKCGASMVKRLNHRTKDHFFGCTKYPSCRGTRTI